MSLTGTRTDDAAGGGRRPFTPRSTSLVVRPWPDPIVEARGHAPDGAYVELFWLGVLGPTATWLVRRLTTGLQAYPEGYELDLTETAAALGLTLVPGRHGPFSRALDRCVMFGMAHHLGEREHDAIAVRRRVPPLAARQVERLPTHLRLAHREWVTAGTALSATEIEIGERIAEVLRAYGDPPGRIERRLIGLGLDPANAVRLSA